MWLIGGCFFTFTYAYYSSVLFKDYTTHVYNNYKFRLIRYKEKTTTEESYQFRVLLYLFVTVPRIDKTYQASPSNNSPNGNPSG